jgi:rare lipoprotein A
MQASQETTFPQNYSGNKTQQNTSPSRNREQKRDNKILNRSERLLKTLTLSVAMILPNGAALPANALPMNASATYYADYFVGRPMANGKKFNQSAMVAAHPSLKMGTRLLVTYKGKSVVVIVSDRCRCSLDLSKAAFSQLAPLSKGRIPVKVTRP